jgi:hypothetical protein
MQCPTAPADGDAQTLTTPGAAVGHGKAQPMIPFDPTRLTVRDPANLLATVPYLLGFNPDPHASLVLVALTGARVLLAARLDLPTPADPATPFQAALTHAATILTGHGATGVILAGYGSAERVEPAVRDASTALRNVHVEVHSALRVQDGRYYQLGCDDPTRCPPEGTPFDPATTIAAATAVHAGLVALPNRRALADTIAPVTGAARTAMTAATIRACQLMQTLADTATTTDPAGTSAATPETPLDHALRLIADRYLADARAAYAAERSTSDDDAALITVLLDDPAVRDAAARYTSGDPWQIRMWTDLVRRAEPAFTAAPACLLAVCALQAGNGALAAIAVRRGLDVDPDYRLAQLLEQALVAGIDPTTITDLLAD